MDVLQRMRDLDRTLNEASRAYYQENRELMPNLEYDRLYDELLALEKQSGIVLSDSPTQHVGYEVVTQLPKKAHAQPMLSLNKTKSVEDLQAFLGGRTGLLSWKMDGLTVVLTYEDGALSEAVTRGNGEIGEIITANARTFVNIPLRIPFAGHLTLRGEAVITYPDFEAVNAALPDTDSRYKNPRNLCSGSVRQLDSAVTAQRHVHFYAFALVEAEGLEFTYRHEQMDWLASQGFETVLNRPVTSDTLPETVKTFASEISANPVPSDGLVLILDDIAYGRSLGRTAKFPRDAIALKWADEQEETRLLYVEWSASRTGLINPVAVFEPVELEGTAVSRASVHNVTILRELRLGYGDTLTVYKANMIIPQIAENKTKSGTCEPPESCPACGGPTELHDQNGVQTLYCPNKDCAAKQIKSFDLFVSREALNVEGLSEATLEKLIDVGCVRRYADLFRLESRKDRILALEGFGEKKYANLLDAAEKARHTTLSRLVIALGIGSVGPATAKALCRHFDQDIGRLRNASAEELEEVDGVGPVIAATIEAYFRNPVRREELDELLGILDIEKEKDSGEGQTLSGMTFVVTGSLGHFANRGALKEQIEQRGGKMSSSVSKNTDALISNDPLSNSAKNRAARGLGVPILTEEAFLSKFLPESHGVAGEGS